jgi:hypothetical protein
MTDKTPGATPPSTGAPSAGDPFGQVRGGSYYQPYAQNGPASRILGAAGQTATTALATLALQPYGATGPIASFIGTIAKGEIVSSAGKVGYSAGSTLGSALDNLGTFEKNFDTMTEELSKSSNWTAPDLGN